MTISLRVLACCLLIGPTLTSFAQPQSVTISGFNHPESVWPTPGAVYVSNMGSQLKPSNKDGDGYISLMNPRGQVLERTFIAGLDAPKGMAIVRGVLYVADVDHVVGFDLKTKAKVFDLNFGAEQTVLLNDLAIKDRQTLFVSATDIGKVYQIDLTAQTYVALPGTLNGPDGLFYDAGRRRLMVANAGRAGQPGDIGLFEENAGQQTYRTLLAGVGAPNGIALLNATSVLISGQETPTGSGQVRRLDLTTNAIQSYGLLASPKDTADFGLFGELLYLPQTNAGTVIIQRL